MSAAQKNKILDLIGRIEDADKMIVFNSANSSKLMAGQYEYQKERLLRELFEELMNMKNLSKYSFQLMYLAINKYYPEITNHKGIGKINTERQPSELRDLEAMLVA